MEVVWTQKAEQDYYNQIDYLLERWDKATAEKFIDQVFETIERLAVHPRLYAPSDYAQVRRAVLNQYISLFYRLEAEGEKIVLLRFWPNRQDPKKLDI